MLFIVPSVSLCDAKNIGSFLLYNRIVFFLLLARMGCSW